MGTEQRPDIEVCNDKSMALPRQADADGFYVHCSGGIRGAQARDDAWMIEPILDGGKASRKGFFSKAQLEQFTRRAGLPAIALQNMGWIDGKYHSSWSPIIPGQTNHLLGPAELWSNVASNMTRQRKGAELRSLKNPTEEEIAALLDDKTEEERLARSISLSLRSMDISVEQIAEFYHEQLVNLMSSGTLKGQRSATSQDQTLFAHVHSFFLHLGAARDYLGAFIAARIGENPKDVDSMAGLLRVLKPQHFGNDKLLDLLLAKGFVCPSPQNPAKWESAGWLKDASGLRNQFVHRRPYGSRHVERFGRAVAISESKGIFRYYRPIVVGDIVENDVLDVIAGHYRNCTGLFYEMAQVSGKDISMFRLTDDDIISINTVKRQS